MKRDAGEHRRAAADRRRRPRRTRPRRRRRRAPARAGARRASRAPRMRCPARRSTRRRFGTSKNSRETNDMAPSSRPISSVANPMKLTISPTLAWPRTCSTVPSTTMAITARVLAARVMHVEQRPPVQHRELVRDDLVHDVAEQPGLGGEAGEGLHQHDVGQRVLGGAGERGSGSAARAAGRPRCGG